MPAKVSAFTSNNTYAIVLCEKYKLKNLMTSSIVDFKKFAVIGSGSWGTAIACHIARIHQSVKLYARSKQTIDEINNYNTNTEYLGNIALPSNIIATDDMSELKDSDVIFIVVPSTSFEEILNQLKTVDLPQSTIFAIASKGIASNPVRLFSELFESKFKNPFVFFSGPTFATEVAAGKFATATISSHDINLAKKLAKNLATSNFEIAATNDIVTIQIASLVKNIIAIKSGILEATNAGENARAWLITKGLQEIAIISKSLGGRSDTLIDAAVIGDLILTSYSKTSRNTKFGFELHQNNYSKEFIHNYPKLTEGMEAAKLIKELVIKHQIALEKLPIINSIINIIE